MGTGGTGGTEAPTAVALTGKGRFTCALMSDRSARCWGRNFDGALGTGMSADTYPTPATVVEMTALRSLSAGLEHTCGVTESGSAWCWGDNADGELGSLGPDTNTPRQVTGFGNGAAIAAGESHTCVLSQDNTTQCWGNNEYGQLGDMSNTSTASPRNVVGLIDAVEVAVGPYHSCARRNGGQVSCWGANFDGCKSPIAC